MRSGKVRNCGRAGAEGVAQMFDVRPLFVVCKAVQSTL
jgi:hypothetical protein